MLPPTAGSPHDERRPLWWSSPYPSASVSRTSTVSRNQTRPQGVSDQQAGLPEAGHRGAIQIPATATVRLANIEFRRNPSDEHQPAAAKITAQMRAFRDRLQGGGPRLLFRLPERIQRVL